MAQKQSGNQPPEKKFSTGVIQCSVWKNQGTSKKTGEPVEFRTVKLERRYTDKDGNWQSSSSLRVNDLPRAALLLQKAFEYLVLKSNGQAPAETGSEPAAEEVIM